VGFYQLACQLGGAFFEFVSRTITLWAERRVNCRTVNCKPRSRRESARVGAGEARAQCVGTICRRAAQQPSVPRASHVRAGTECAVLDDCQLERAKGEGLKEEAGWRR